MPWEWSQLFPLGWGESRPVCVKLTGLTWILVPMGCLDSLQALPSPQNPAQVILMASDELVEPQMPVQLPVFCSPLWAHRDWGALGSS